MIAANCDDASSTGLHHAGRGEVGQDYTLSGTAGDGEVSCRFVAVSDGCSGGTRTDIGSRLACLSARLVAPAACRGFSAHPVSLMLREHICRTQLDLHLATTDLLATCLLAVVREDGSSRVLVFGDGVVVVRYRDGSALITHFEWSENTPFYPAYPNLAILQSRGSQLARTDSLISKEGDVLSMETRSAPAGEHEDLCDISHSADASIAQVALFTDGICQVEGPSGEQVPIPVAARRLLDFKNTRGFFVKRRLGAFLKNLARDGGRAHDDLSAAVINFEPRGEDARG